MRPEYKYVPLLLKSALSYLPGAEIFGITIQRVWLQICWILSKNSVYQNYRKKLAQTGENKNGTIKPNMAEELFISKNWVQLNLILINILIVNNTVDRQR